MRKCWFGKSGFSSTHKRNRGGMWLIARSAGDFWNDPYTFSGEVPTVPSHCGRNTPLPVLQSERPYLKLSDFRFEQADIGKGRIMKIAYEGLLTALLVGAALVPASAGTISNIAFTSGNGGIINDTIVGNGTSPLAFTASTGTDQPFLNAPDSSITLSYGSYFAIAFAGDAEHIGPGTVSFLLDGVTPQNQVVTFPDPTLLSGVFADFALPGGDSVTISATGTLADRIQIQADGGGLVGDGAPDAFYLFNFTSGATQTPEPATGALMAGGWVTLWAIRRRLFRR
jgi:hypothetical protein